MWIANGTGVAPFVSMARVGLSEGKFLLHGARELADFYFQDELAFIMGERYLRCCSLPGPRAGFGLGAGLGFHAGRLTAYLESRSWDPAQSYELCGSASMVVDVRELLIAKGIPHSRIVSEVYY